MFQNSYSLIKKILLYRLKKDFTFESFRDRIFSRPAAILHALNISPNALSIMGIALVMIAMLCLDYPIIAALLLIINLMIDGLDGVVARLYHLDTFMGSLMDTICDTLGSIIIVFGLSLYYQLDYLYPFLWILLIAFYSITSAIYSIKVEQRSKVIGFRNMINIGAIALLFYLSFQMKEPQHVAAIITYYMNPISFILAVLSFYAILRIWVIQKSNI